MRPYERSCLCFGRTETEGPFIDLENQLCSYLAPWSRNALGGTRKIGGLGVAGPEMMVNFATKASQLLPYFNEQRWGKPQIRL